MYFRFQSIFLLIFCKECYVCRTMKKRKKKGYSAVLLEEVLQHCLQYVGCFLHLQVSPNSSNWRKTHEGLEINKANNVLSEVNL